MKLKVLTTASTVLLLLGCAAANSSNETSNATVQPQQLPASVYLVGRKGCQAKGGCINSTKSKDFAVWAESFDSEKDVRIHRTVSSIGGVRDHIFVRSKGCLLTDPTKEAFYYTGVALYQGEKRNAAKIAPSQVTVVAERVDQDKAIPLVEFVRMTAQQRQFRVMGSTGQCLSLED
ncbi:MAG: hypothetical protein KME10_25230 [Plectolyngbya sp. WJT66-NPBG17]|jgi:hypothetical protein|nr:hypothetical protein [Plectolyngbya sp. WJT66-NPBG17]